jgi:hypothetical protein
MSLPPNVRREAGPGGIRYLATCHGKPYISLDYHRNRSRRSEKSIWRAIFSRDDEFRLFDRADNLDWQDNLSGYWAVVEGIVTEIGADGERIAWFRYPSNPSDDWHGFPLFLDQNRRPDQSLAQRWIDTQVVSFVIGEKIKRGRL